MKLFCCIISLLLLSGCCDLRTQTDYFPEENGFFGCFSDINKFEYNPDKIYVLKKDAYFFRNYFGNYKLTLNSEAPYIISKIPTGTKFKASRVRRYSEYSFIFLMRRMELFLEVVNEGTFLGQEFIVNDLSIKPFDNYEKAIRRGDHRAKYSDLKVDLRVFEEIDDDQKNVTERKSVSELIHYQWINNLNFF